MHLPVIRGVGVVSTALVASTALTCLEIPRIRPVRGEEIQWEDGRDSGGTGIVGIDWSGRISGSMLRQCRILDLDGAQSRVDGALSGVWSGQSDVIDAFWMRRAWLCLDGGPFRLESDLPAAMQTSRRAESGISEAHGNREMRPPPPGFIWKRRSERICERIEMVQRDDGEQQEAVTRENPGIGSRGSVSPGVAIEESERGWVLSMRAWCSCAEISGVPRVNT